MYADKKGFNREKLLLNQLEENLTVLLGGFQNGHAIFTYNWNTMEYKQQTSVLAGNRVMSGCALLRKDKYGPLLVVVAGGFYADSKGMEAWNPVDGSVETIVPELTQEVGQPAGLRNFAMFSIYDKTELLFFGGFVGSVVLSDVWKFRFFDQSWIQLKSMSNSRTEITVIPVTGFTC